jgi:hypothetical protein
VLRGDDSDIKFDDSDSGSGRTIQDPATRDYIRGLLRSVVCRSARHPLIATHPAACAACDDLVLVRACPPAVLDELCILLTMSS